MSDADKSLDPTPHRRQRAREQGHVAKSQDLSSALVLLLGLIVLLLLGKGLITFLVRFTQRQIGGEWLTEDLQFGAGEAATQWNVTLYSLAGHVLPILGVLVAIAVAVSVVQVGFLFLPQRLAFDVTRLSPMRGMGRIFSLDGLAKLVFGLLKIAVIAVVAGVSLYGQRGTILGLSGLEAPQMAAGLLEIVLWTTIKIAVALFILGIVDYAFQRWKHERDLRMTPQELREELRNLEPSREVTARRKQLRREMVAGRKEMRE
jgi:flagellar biosynthetic protein FlhB